MSLSGTEPNPPIPSDILDAALALNESQRLALGHHLIESVEAVGSAPYPGWPEDWEEELERRSLAIERGEPTFSLEEVIARAREAIHQAKESHQASAVTP